MKKFHSVTISIVLMFVNIYVIAQPQPEKYAYDLTYFLPQTNYLYNEDIPTPKNVIGFELGQQHVDWGQVVMYMKALAETSSRVTVNEKGCTYEHRPFLEVIITSPDNQRKIEKIKEEHLKLTDINQSFSLNSKKMPLVISLIYSVHGNEPSGVNASLAFAYFLAAAESKSIEELLTHTIIVMTPGANPDGINRFASWVNTSRSLTDVSDPNSREFSESWPSSRTNHYWADGNRDWLMAQHPEGIHALNTYFEWLPNVVADFHEQRFTPLFYFSPGHPKRVHPFISPLNQELTSEISTYCAKEMDKIGIRYYSKERYDDYYCGKAATYGDLHGSICLLYEQGSIRGHLKETEEGLFSFPWAIRNQVLASYATISAAYDIREKLLNYQKEYFQQTAKNVHNEIIKGYIFDTRGSKSIAYHFLENMVYHHIDVFHLAKDYSSFKKSDAYVIPMEQKYSVMVKALMENCLEYDDSIFYDISTWTFPHAFNLRYLPVKSVSDLIGEKLTENVFYEGQIIGGKSNYGYVFDNKEFYAPKVIYELQKRNIHISVSNMPFAFLSENINKQMGYGTLFVSAQNQSLSSDDLYNLLEHLSKETGVDIYAATSGLMPDIDLGSPSYLPLKQPKVAIIVGENMDASESGEIWYLLDKRFQMCPTLIESNDLTVEKLQKYNVVVMANGIPNFDKASEKSLKEWITNGGTLIATGKAYEWLNNEKILHLKIKNTCLKKDSTLYLAYADKKIANAGDLIPGTIMNCDLDKTHPLMWGLDQDKIAVMKTGNIIFEKDADPYISPLHYSSKPLLSGFLSSKNERLLKNAPALFAKQYKKGIVILFVDDMNFRSYWFGTSKIFMNAVFFNKCIN